MAGVNRITRTVERKTVLPEMKGAVSSATNINQGDLCVFDTTTNRVRAVTTGDDGTTFIGISEETIVNGILARPYSTAVDASGAELALPGPVFGVVARLVLKTGDTVVAGGLVYLDVAAGAFHVTSTAGALKAIGIAQADITGAAAGQTLEVLLGCRYPQDTLKV